MISPFFTPPFGMIDLIVLPFTCVENSYPSLRSRGARTLIFLFKIDFGVFFFFFSSSYGPSWEISIRKISPFETSLGFEVETEDNA